MSAFGRKNGPAGMAPGARPQFGVARPMQGGGAAPRPQGGEQFPPLPGSAPAAAPSAGSSRPTSPEEGMARLNERMNSTHSGQSEVGGFEASVHKIKEQVLPRLLERVDPEAAATLSKEELSEEFRPIILEVLAELKADAALRQIPVVVLTASEEETDVARSYHNHANCYVTKPLDADKFLQVARCIEGFWLDIVLLPGR